MRPPSLAVSIHDVAPSTWPECSRLLEVLDRLQLPATLLLVPRYHGELPIAPGSALATQLRRRVARGDEVVLHGYFHLDDGPPPATVLEWLKRRALTASEGEFSALDEVTAGQRLRAGAACLARAGLEPAGFIPPAWLLGRAARQALERTGLAYTSTRDELIRLDDGQVSPAPSLVWSTRARWRRTASLLWNARRAEALAAAPLVRVALHPPDAGFPVILQQVRQLLAALSARREPVLESRWIAEQPVAAA